MDIVAQNKFEAEFSVDNRGIATASIRGVARLAGVADSTLRSLIGRVREKKGGERLNAFADEALMCAKNGISERFATAIISHYAYKGRDVARDSVEAFQQAGFRKFVQELVGWEADAHQKLLQRYVLIEPDEWTKRFPDLFYEFLAELTKQSIPQLPKRGRPPLWAALTKRWIYDRLPHEIGVALEESRNADDASRYLHTHLTSDGIELFKGHMAQLTTIMQGAASWQDVDRMLANIDANARQMELKLCK